MSPAAPVSMLPASSNGGAAFIVGAALIVAMIYARKQQKVPVPAPATK